MRDLAISYLGESVVLLAERLHWSTNDPRRFWSMPYGCRNLVSNLSGVEQENFFALAKFQLACKQIERTPQCQLLQNESSSVN